MSARRSNEAVPEMVSSSTNHYGSGNLGVQVGQNYGSVHNEFHLPLSPSETQPEPFVSIPFGRDPRFIPRGGLLDQVRDRRAEYPHRVALVGLGGVGKSQLAIEYAYRIKAEEPRTWVFWVYAATRQRVNEGLRDIAEAVKLAGRQSPTANIPLLVKNWLTNERNGRWILILDSADDFSIFNTKGDGDSAPLATYFPTSQNGSVIVTTRNKDVADKLAGSRDNAVEVGTMTETEALELLDHRMGSPASSWNKDEALALVQALDMVPLAIQQAAGYIRANERRISLAAYLNKLQAIKEQAAARLLATESGGDLRRDAEASNAVLTTWTVSFDRLREDRRSAADLLALISFFDRQGIPGWVLKAYRPSKAGTQPSGGTVATEEETGSDADDMDVDTFEEDVAALRNYCLITLNTNRDEYATHRLVQLSTRAWLDSSRQLESWKAQYIELMAYSFPTGDYENWPTCERLFAHAQAALAHQLKRYPHKAYAKLFYNAGWYAFVRGRNGVAEEMVRKAWETERERYGNENMTATETQVLLAAICRYRGKWPDAEGLLKQFLEKSRATSATEYASTLVAMHELGTLYNQQGRYSEAEALLTKVVETQRAALGADHPDTLTSMRILAQTYHAQGRWSEAETILIKVLEKRQVVFGADHPNTLISMRSLAQTYHGQGRWSEAETILIEVLEKQQAGLGADHPDTLASMGSLAQTYHGQGRWSEAETILIKVLEKRRAVLGADHPDTLWTMHALARSLHGDGREAEALALMRSCVQACRRVLGADHPNTRNSMAVVDMIERSLTS